jgi:HEAT repeat protein
MRLPYAVVLVALLGAPAAARPRDEALVTLLSGGEWVPGRSDLASRGVDAADLMALYGDEDVAVVVRIRAVELLVHFPDPAVRVFLDGVARARGAHAALLRAAATSLAPHGDVAVATLARLVCHPDRSVREAAARALGTIRTPASWSALRRRRAAEPDDNVRRAIDVALAAAPAP